MVDLIYIIFASLTVLPVNIWFWLLLIAAPALVFVAKPNHSFWWRLGRLILAVGLTYGLIMLTLEMERRQSWQDYNECYASHSELRDMSPERNDACRHNLERVPDSTRVFLFLFGYIPAIVYAGFWELLWRIRYRQEIKKLGKKYKGTWGSNILILASIIIGLFIVYFTFKVYYYMLFIKA